MGPNTLELGRACLLGLGAGARLMEMLLPVSSVLGEGVAPGELLTYSPLLECRRAPTPVIWEAGDESPQRIPRWRGKQAYGIT